MENNTIKVIDKDVNVTIEINARFIDVMYEILNERIEKYGKENFMKLAKEIIDEGYIPKKGIELEITVLSSMALLFEKNAIEQNKFKEMTVEEYQKFNGN